MLKFISLSGVLSNCNKFVIEEKQGDKLALYISHYKALIQQFKSSLIDSIDRKSGGQPSATIASRLKRNWCLVSTRPTLQHAYI